MTQLEAIEAYRVALIERDRAARELDAADEARAAAGAAVEKATNDSIRCQDALRTARLNLNRVLLEGTK